MLGSFRNVAFGTYGTIGCFGILIVPLIVGAVLLAGDPEPSPARTQVPAKPSVSSSAPQVAVKSALLGGFSLSSSDAELLSNGFEKCWDQFPGRYCQKENFSLLGGPKLTAQVIRGDEPAKMRIFDVEFRREPLDKTVDLLKAHGWRSSSIGHGESSLSRSGENLVIRYDPWTTAGSFPTLTVVSR